MNLSLQKHILQEVNVYVNFCKMSLDKPSAWC